MNHQLTEQEKKQKKNEYMKAYMKDYKKKKYDENPEPFLRKNKSRYMAKTADIPAEDITKYGEFLYSVRTAEALLSELLTNRPDLLREVCVRAGVTSGHLVASL